YDFVHKLQRDPSRLEVLGDGTQSKPYVHVQDCLDGMEFGVANSSADVNYYNLAVDDHTSVREITEWTLEAMGIDRGAIDVEFGDQPRGWRGDVAQVRMDTRKMSALGWRPKMTSREAVRRGIEEIVAQLT